MMEHARTQKPGTRIPPFQFQPVILVAAARSGTNMLRDLLTEIPSVATWPCDEINYIWRQGNAGVDHDELDPGIHLRPRIERGIREAFALQARATGCEFLIEKTCANSLRLPFVDAVVPEAKYLLLIRDGRDVVASAMKRWKAPLDLEYLARKANFVPWYELPGYAWRYCLNRLRKLFASDGRLASWGPKFEGMAERARTMPLEELCALQWKRCVDQSQDFLGSLPPERVHVLTYEQLCSAPTEELRRICDFLRIDLAVDAARRITANVRGENSGGWKRDWSPDMIQRVERVLGDSLTLSGYSLTTPARAAA